MKTLYNYSNYSNDLRITRADAIKCHHAGDCENDVLDLLKKPYIKKQIKTLNPETLSKELKDYGAWDSEELKNHEQNIVRWVWLSACDIAERLKN